MFINLDISIIIFHRIGNIFLAQYVSRSHSDQEKVIELSGIISKTGPSVNINSFIICEILVVSYLLIWQ